MSEEYNKFIGYTKYYILTDWKHIDGQTHQKETNSFSQALPRPYTYEEVEKDNGFRNPVRRLKKLYRVQREITKYGEILHAKQTGIVVDLKHNGTKHQLKTFIIQTSFVVAHLYHRAFKHILKCTKQKQFFSRLLTHLKNSVYRIFYPKYP